MKKKKWRDIRNAVTMMCVMVAMLSTATYAWFTLTSNPTVTGMEMVASSGSGLSVSNSVNETFVNAIEIKEDSANMNLADAANPDRLLRLIPVSVGTTDGTTPVGFCDPKYNANGIVTALERDASDVLITLGDEDMVGKIAVYTYYIKSESGNVNVAIRTGDASQAAKSEVNAAYQAIASGTFVRARGLADGETADNAVQQAVGAIRIGLVVTQANSDGSYDEPNIEDMIIIEPNNDFVVSGTDITSANVELNGLDLSAYTETILANKVSAKINGEITTGKGTDNYTSVPLFTVSETPKEVTMYIWLEGTDSQCVDQIKTDELEAQIQFVGLDETDTTSNNLVKTN